MLVEYVVRGAKAGAVAGLAFGLLVALVANPLLGIAEAHAHEGGHVDGGDHDAGHDEAHATDHGHESAVPGIVTEFVSVVAGVLWGVLLGGVVLGAGMYLLEPALPGTGAVKSYVLAGGGFLTVSGAPWLVLPPRPPGVPDALPIDTRILLYGGAMAAGAVAFLAGLWTHRRLAASRSGPVAALGGLLPVAVVAGGLALIPTGGGASTAAGHVPAALAAGVTGFAVAGQVVLWLCLAAVHTHLHADSSGGAVAADAGPHPAAD